jgi:hypothetical protein
MSIKIQRISLQGKSLTQSTDSVNRRNLSLRTNINRVLWGNAQTLDETVTSRLIYIQKATYAFMSHGENSWQHRNIKTGNKIFKMSGLLDDHNKSISHKSILKWGMLVRHHSVQNLLPSNCNFTSWFVWVWNLVSCPKHLHVFIW